MPRHRRILGTQAQVIRKRATNVYAGQKRRAAKHKQALNYTAAEIWAMAKDLPPCHYCKKPVSARDFSLDHLNPVSRGGSFKLENLVCVHDRCNRLKSSLTEAEYEGLIDLLREYRKLHGEYAVKNVEMRLLAGGAWQFSLWGR